MKSVMIKRCICTMLVAIMSFYTANVEAIPPVLNLNVNDGTQWEIVYNENARSVLYSDDKIILETLPQFSGIFARIRTASKSKNYNGNTLATLKVAFDCSIYIAYDDLIKPKPSWIAGFQKTGEYIFDFNSNKFYLYKKWYPANSTINLGENGSKNGAMYTVFVEISDMKNKRNDGMENTISVESIGVSTHEDEALKGEIPKKGMDEKLSYKIESNPSNGTTSIDQDGKWVYMPTPNYNGRDSFLISVADANPPIKELNIMDAKQRKKWELTQYFNSGDVQYSDRNYTLDVIPERVVGCYWIKTPMDSKQYTGDVLASFKTTSELTVYVAYDDAKSRPGWLSDWVDIGDDIINSNAGTFSLYAKTFNKDTIVTLGDNGNANAYMYYVILDQKGKIKKYEYNMGVSPVNDPPKIKDVEIIMVKDTVRTGKIEAVDIDGDQLNFSIKTKAQNGTVEVNNDEWIYKPDARFAGKDSFSILVNDGRDQVYNTVSVTVNEMNSSPVAKDYSMVIMPEEKVEGNIEAQDPEEDALTYNINEKAKNGTLKVDSEGHWEYAPKYGYIGDDRFSITIEDQNGGKAVSRVSIVVNPVLIDEMDSFSKMYYHTDGLKIESSDSEPYDWDVGRLGRGSAPKDAGIIYKTPFDMKSIWMVTYKHRKAPGQAFRIYVSEDNKSYTEIKVVPREAPKGGNEHMLQELYETNKLPARTRYLKIVFLEKPVGLSNWDPKIGRIAINEEDNSTFDPTYKGITSKQVIDMLREKNADNQHPRLIATANDFERIRKGILTDDVLKIWYDEIRVDADNILNQPPNKYQIPDPYQKKPHILWISRSVLERIEKLSMVYQVSKEPKYAQRAWEELKVVAGADTQNPFPDWYMAHFLDTAEMCAAVAIGYDWLYDALSPYQRAVLKNAIVERALKPVADAYRGKWAFTKYEMNINTVCNSGVTLGALAVGDEVPELAGEVIIGALKSVDSSIKQYRPDGGFVEGPTYWNYGTTYAIQMFAALESALGTSFELANSEGFSETAYFPLYVSGPSGSFNYGDADRKVELSSILLWLADKYGKKDLAWFNAKNNIGSGVYGLLWYNHNSYNASADYKLEYDKIFKRVAIGSIRSGWNDEQAIVIPFKAGSNQASHGDLDLGTFTLDALGVNWVCDLGLEDYYLQGIWNWKNVLDGGRWNYYRKRAEGHNTIVINPNTKPDQYPLAVTSFTKFESSLSKAIAIMDLTPAYTDATSVKRGISLMDNRTKILVQDEIKTKSTSEVWWFMHTKTDVEILEDGSYAVLKLGEKRVGVKILSDNMKFVVMDAKPLPSSPNPDLLEGNVRNNVKQNNNQGVKKLAIKLNNVTETTISVLIMPLLPEDTMPEHLPDIIPLDEWTSQERETARLTGIQLDGLEVADFTPSKVAYHVELPSYTKKIPLVTVKTKYDVEISQAKDLNGMATIIVTDPTGILGKTVYKVKLKVKVAESVMTSGDDGNVGKNTIDNNLQTRWAASGDGKWIKYDLGVSRRVDGVSIAWFKGNERTGYFDIEVSDDAENWTTVYKDGKSSGESLELERYSFEAIGAHYVRIVGHGTSQSKLNSLTEVVIHSKDE